MAEEAKTDAELSKDKNEKKRKSRGEKTTKELKPKRVHKKHKSEEESRPAKDNPAETSTVKSIADLFVSNSTDPTLAALFQSNVHLFSMYIHANISLGHCRQGRP